MATSLQDGWLRARPFFFDQSSTLMFQGALPHHAESYACLEEERTDDRRRGDQEHRCCSAALLKALFFTHSAISSV